jgi:lipopolysaccharide export LptBFGC system permease protein LptF
MQSRVLKIVVAGVILFLAGITPTLGQISGFRLQQADSLYIDKKYTQSLEHYKTILNQDQYTPAMLLKMAYIEEGLNQIGPALYHLNLYYIATNDKTVLTKMEEVATRYNLEGYENSDAEQAVTFYHDYHFHITLALGVIAIFLMSLSISRRRKGKRPIATGILTAFVLIALFVHVNVGGKISLGVVGSSNTFLMQGPSPGAPLVQIVNEGHRVEIIGKKDVWVEVLWEGEPAYIKEGNLLTVEL